MFLLPAKIGPFTLMRRLGSTGVTETYSGILDEPAGKQVLVHRLVPSLALSDTLLPDIEARVRDLIAIRHPSLLDVLDWVEHGQERFVVQAWVPTVHLGQVLDRCRREGLTLPPHLFLDLATQICNGLEALHGRPGAASGRDHVLHLGLTPRAVGLDASGTVRLGAFGLVRSPTILPFGGASNPALPELEYLAPEQTFPDRPLGPETDIFSLGVLLYELLTLEPLFRAATHLQTIHAVRRAEVSARLLEVKERMPGLDKVLYRALSLNPRHRYQRAFVLREDLRGLMAGYSFATRDDDVQAFLAPLFPAGDPLPGSVAADGPEASFPRSVPPPPRPPAAADPDGPPAPPIDEDALLLGDDEAAEPLADPSPGGDGLLDDAGALLLDDGDGAPEAPAPPPDEVPTPPPPAPVAPAEADASDGSAPPPGGATEADVPAPVHDGLDDPSITRWEPVSEPDPPPAAPPPPPEPPPGLSGPDAWDDPPPSEGRRGVLLGLGAGLAALGAVLLCVGVPGVVWWMSPGASPPPVAATGSAPPAPAPPPVAAADVAPPPPAPPEATATASPGDGIREEAAPASPPPSPPAPPRTAATTIGAHPRRASPPPSPPAPPRTAAPSRPSSTEAAPRPPPPRPIAPGSLPAVAPVEAPPIAVAPDGDLARYVDLAYRGHLTDDDRMALQMIARTDPRFTEAQALLYQNAKARGDQFGRERHLEAILSLPENEYDPAFLVEQAELYLRRGDYDAALERARTAERHWARLPSELMFSRKAMIYETEALALQGRFYASDGADLDALYRSIRAWERYRSHVAAGARDDLVARADDQIARLTDMKERLE